MINFMLRTNNFGRVSWEVYGNPCYRGQTLRKRSVRVIGAWTAWWFLLQNYELALDLLPSVTLYEIHPHPCTCARFRKFRIFGTTSALRKFYNFLNSKMTQSQKDLKNTFLGSTFFLSNWNLISLSDIPYCSTILKERTHSVKGFCCPRWSVLGEAPFISYEILVNRTASLVNPFCRAGKCQETYSAQNVKYISKS